MGAFLVLENLPSTDAGSVRSYRENKASNLLRLWQRSVDSFSIQSCPHTMIEAADMMSRANSLQDLDLVNWYNTEYKMIVMIYQFVCAYIIGCLYSYVLYSTS